MTDQMIKTRLLIIGLLRQRKWTEKQLAEHINAKSKQVAKYHLVNLMQRGIAKREWPSDVEFPERKSYLYWID